MRRAFTLIELLVVISIISLLMGILLPALSNARERANQVMCETRVKNLLWATHMYCTENKDFMPFGNSEGLVKWALSGRQADDLRDFSALRGWLYQAATTGSYPGQPNYTATPDVTDQEMTGALWDYLGSKKAYRCPTDRTSPGTPYFPTVGWTTKDLSSYTMNGAVNAYARKGSGAEDPYPVYPAQHKDSMRPDGVCFWEVDENNSEGAAKLYNDGNNRPDEGITTRHLSGASVGLFDGRVTWWTIQQFNNEAQLGPGKLWCDWTEPDGGMNTYKSTSGG